MRDVFFVLSIEKQKCAIFLSIEQEEIHTKSKTYPF